MSADRTGCPVSAVTTRPERVAGTGWGAGGPAGADGGGGGGGGSACCAWTVKAANKNPTAYQAAQQRHRFTTNETVAVEPFAAGNGVATSLRLSRLLRICPAIPIFRGHHQAAR